MQEHIINVILLLFICLGVLYLESSSGDELRHLLWVISGPTHLVAIASVWQSSISP